MLNIKDKCILECIIKHSQNILEDISDLSEDEFYNDRKTINSVCFDILQIGELAKSLSDDFISKYNQMPWKNIKGMRDWVTHGYHSLEMTRVWKTASDDIKPLLEYCKKINQEDK